MMLPLSWHQREDLWSSNAAMSRAETLHSAQVTPPLYHACLSGITNDETVSSAVKIAVSNETAFWACRWDILIISTPRMRFSLSVGIIPGVWPWAFVFAAGQLETQAGPPGCKTSSGLPQPPSGACKQPQTLASARPHPPHAGSIGVAICRGRMTSTSRARAANVSEHERNGCSEHC